MQHYTMLLRRSIPLLLTLLFLLPALTSQAAVHERTLPLAEAWDPASPSGRWLASVTAAPDEDRALAPSLTWWWLLDDGERIVSAELLGEQEEVLAELSRTPLQQALIGEDGSATLQAGGEPLWQDAYAVNLTPPRTLHGRNLQAITLTPLRAEAGRLYGLKAARLKLTTAAVSLPAGLVPQRPDFPLRERILASLGDGLLNPESLPETVADRAVGGGNFPTEVPSVEGSAVDMVIVTLDSFADLCQTYADHKTEYGTATVVRTLEWIADRYPQGSDRAELVRRFVQDAYAKWSIRYLLIVADAPQIPPRYAYTKVFPSDRTTPTDLYYGGLDGDWNADHDFNWAEGADSVHNDPGDEADFLPEVYVGRISVSNRMTCAYALNKSRAYHEADNHPYQDRMLMMGEVLFPEDYPTNPNIILHGAWACESIFGNYTGSEQHVVRLYETASIWNNPSILELNSSSAFDSMNHGFNIVLHNGHGFRQTMSVGSNAGRLQNGDIALLDNGDNYFLLYMINCTAAAIDFNCLAEAFLINPSGGAFAVIGSVRESFPTVSQQYMNVFFDRLYNDKSLRLGDLFFNSLNEFEPLTLQDNAFRWAHQTMILLGDPSNWLHYRAVQALSTTLPPVYSLNAGPLTVTVRNPASQPVPNAQVCLRKGDQDYQRKVTNGSGQATFTLAAETGGTYQARVEARDFKLYSYAFTVTEPSSNPWLTIKTITVNDVNGGSIHGNGNGVAERGETVKLTLQLQNQGSITATNVSGSLSSTHPNVVIVDASDTYGNIATHVLSSGSGGYLVTIGDAPDDAIFNFSLTMTCDQSVKVDDFYLEGASPLLTVYRSVINDAGGGDGDGVLEVGETAAISVRLSNYGRATAQGVTAVATAPAGSGLTILQGTDVLGNLAALTTNLGPADFMVQRINSNPPNLQLRLTDTLARADTLDLLLVKPVGVPGAPTFSPGTDATRLRLDWDPPAAEDAAAYVVLRAAAPGGPFVSVSEHWVDSSSLEDYGLEPYTSYWYKVQPLSSAGVLGTASSVAEAKTNPGLLPGWPKTLHTSTTSTPLVADVDGDGDLELLVGADLLYGFNPDGTELSDGDGDPKTIGPISPLGESFATAIAAADLTDSPGLEVVATSWNSLQVFVFEFTKIGNHTWANVAPGWPRSVAHFDGIWASPSLGDVTGDHVPEIFVAETGPNGALMAWRANGNEVINGDNNPNTQGVFFTNMGSWPRSTVAFADIEDDGIKELFVGTSNGYLRGFRGTGQALPGFPFYAAGGEGNIGIFSSPAVGDVDGDGFPEIVFTSENDSLYVLDHNGHRHPGWPVPWVNNDFAWCSSPALADLTGDGLPEIFASSVVHRDLDMTVAWFDASGDFLPGWPRTYHASTQSSPVVADIDGDGHFETIQGTEDGLVLAWHDDGEPVAGFPILTGDYVRGTPTIADLNQDGDMDMCLAGWDMSLYVWTFPSPFAPEEVPWYTFMHDQRRTGNFGTMDGIVAVDDGALPSAIRLESNWPNPFNPTTQIRFAVPVGGQSVRLSIHDVTGRLVAELVNEPLGAGNYERKWDGRDQSGKAAASGIYFARLQVDARVVTTKMTLLK